MGKYSSHSLYVNENKEEVPSVTTIIKLLHKESLDGWIWWLGRKGERQKDVLDKSSSFGTNVHNALEALLLEKPFMSNFQYPDEKQRLARALNNFLNWKEDNELEPIFMEKKFVSEKFGGTVDFYGILNGKKTICDFKTSSGYYSSMWLQLASYWYLLELENYEVEQVCIIRVNDKICEHKIMQLDEIKDLREDFHKLVDFYLTWHKFNNGKF